MNNKIDLISKKLRRAEKKIDTEYKKNPLTNLEFAEAAWYLLSFYEDTIFIKEFDNIQSGKFDIHEKAAFADNFIVTLQYPLRWLSKSCRPNGEVPKNISEENYENCLSLWRLSQNYNAYDSAFTMASNGRIKLYLHGKNINPSKNVFCDAMYEAYDRMITLSISKQDIDFSNLFIQLIKNIKINQPFFDYDLNDDLIQITKEILKPIARRIYELPQNWEFLFFTLIEFRSMAEIIHSLSYIHYMARTIAALNGCEMAGFRNALLILSPHEVINIIERNTNIDRRKIEIFINYLTYGSSGIDKADPALQPLIPLNNSNLAISPNLIMHNSLERNFCVLVNRIENEKRTYESFVNYKENNLKRKIKSELSGCGYRFNEGNIHFPEKDHEIDLVIISDKDRATLVVELKWFISPSEVREVIEKTLEIQNGISQLKSLMESTVKNKNVINDRFEIDVDYKIFYIVASANSIGAGWAQDEHIPVININHLVYEIQRVRDLNSIIEWLSKRRYLPIKERDFKIKKFKYSIGEYLLGWYGVQVRKQYNVSNLDLVD